MSTFLERLITEQKELSEKISKLHDYISNNSHFETLTERNQELLEDQYETMSNYNSILLERIKINR
ncbi:gp213 [Sphingomonas phage PAU]|uniref:gp213 n=1 Tax=Sphingomonas phage PAU TaxID=1150991 RepID=UPI0002573373|nr:gp213 [Sphingomonas phage PAU]AFF28211.1 gp213 [Sphingomonas phage PAU]